MGYRNEHGIPDGTQFDVMPRLCVECPVPSEERMTRLLAIINTRTKYSMRELAECCRELRGRIPSEDRSLL